MAATQRTPELSLETPSPVAGVSIAIPQPTRQNGPRASVTRAFMTILGLLASVGCASNDPSEGSSNVNAVGGTVGPGGSGSTSGPGTSGVGGSQPSTVTSGGTVANGGATTTTGASSSGGATGTTSMGGAVSTGGAVSMGGAVGTVSVGGAAGTSSNGGGAGTASNGGGGGTAGACATDSANTGDGPVLVSTIDLNGVSGCPGMRLGDIDGDGRMEIVVGQPIDQNSLDSYTPQVVATVTAFDLEGNQLWQVGTPNRFHVASSDIPIQVYDMDGDGKAEVFANMSTSQMSVLDGASGELMRTIPLPASGANDSIQFTNLRGTEWPQDIIVKTRYGRFWAITGMDSAAGSAGTVLWTHVKGPDTGFSDLSTGHYALVYDWNGDGKDEVMGGYDFMDSEGNTLWSVTTLKLHADAIATGDIDGNPNNGNEIIVCGDVAAAFDWSTGDVLWQDDHTTEVQQLGIGDYRPDLAGLEVVLLDRLRTSELGLKSNNLLVDQFDNVLWHEDRPYDSGWLTVTENLNNWDGTGADFILSYRRGDGGAFLYDGDQNTVAEFPYPGSDEENFALHADLCGDAREEVIVYDSSTAWIYSNGGCDLSAPPCQSSLPQQYHLYNWSIYTGWMTPDVKFYTSGSTQ